MKIVSIISVIFHIAIAIALLLSGIYIAGVLSALMGTSLGMVVKQEYFNKTKTDEVEVTTNFN